MDFPNGTYIFGLDALGAGGTDLFFLPNAFLLGRLGSPATFEPPIPMSRSSFALNFGFYLAFSNFSNSCSLLSFIISVDSDLKSSDSLGV